MHAVVRKLYVPFIATAIACGYRDVPGDRRIEGKYVVLAAAPNQITVQPENCPTQKIVMTWDPAAKKQSRHGTDFACLAKIKVGDHIEDVRQREKQGCMPGKVYHSLLGECDSSEVMTGAVEGAPCK